MSETITGRVRGLASRVPHELAIAGVRADSDVTWTWSQLWKRSEQVAALLRQLEVRPGEVVAYQLPNRVEFVAITLGVLLAGGVCCPLMPIYREHELLFMLSRARARVLFALDELRGRHHAAEIAALEPQLGALEHVVVLGDEPERIPAARAGAAGHVRWSAWSAMGADSDAQPERTRPASEQADIPQPANAHRGAADEAGAGEGVTTSDALAQLLFTSGTSGLPKGVLHRQDVLTEAAAMQAAHLGLGAQDRIYVPSPLAHQTGFLYGMWLALSLGVAQIVQETWDPVRGLAALRAWGGTFAQAAPTFLADLTSAVENGALAPVNLRLFVATGAAVPHAIAERGGRALGAGICGAFGTTEGCLATLGSLADPPEKAQRSDGRPLHGVGIRVRDEQGNLLAAGREGHFETRSPTMFAGYLEDPAATVRTFTSDGWYRTGDLAMIDADGYLHVTGRVKDVINRGGEKIPVAHIEQLLYQHAAVKEVAIVAMPDERLGERACAFIVPQGAASFDLGVLQAFLDQQRVARQYWPERVELVDALPRTASGKVRKYQLRERAGNLGAGRSPGAMA